MNKKIMQLLIVGFFGMVLILGFQNCSKVSPSSLDAASEKASSDISVATPDSGNATLPTAGAGDDSSHHNTNSGMGCSDVGEEQVNKSPEQQAAQAIAYCVKEKSDLAEGASFQHTRGSLKAEGSNISYIEDVRGSLGVWGIGDHAQVGKIIDVRGHTVICNMHVDSISNIRGGVVLVNSTVGSVDDIRGRLLMVNSKVNQIGDVHGSIMTRNP